MERQRILARAALLCALGTLAAGVAPARANGDYSHVWMAVDALRYVEDGALHDLLSRDDMRRMLRNGAMFPDGGYAVGDGYGEISHWEPFHLAYLDWIRFSFEPPWSDEAARHVAFLMGMAAHGLSDQLYDGMYLTRHAHHDHHGDEAALLGIDGATDACFALTRGTMALPEPWVPAEVLAPLYDSLRGHQVSPETIEDGQRLIVVAIMAANDAVAHPEVVDEYMELYPWACGHQDDPAAPGSPLTHGPAIARYWQVLWDRLHGGEGFGQPLSGTFSTGMTGYDVPRDASNPDSWVSFAMPRGLAAATVTPETVTVAAGDGHEHPVDLHVHYGHHSHLVNIKPLEDWGADEDYAVTISPPITSWDGAVLEKNRSFIFSTGSAPLPADTTTSDAGDEDPPQRGGGSCDRSGGTPAPSLLLLLGALLILRSALQLRQHPLRYSVHEVRGNCGLAGEPPGEAP